MVTQNASSETRTLGIRGELFNGDAVVHMSHGTGGISALGDGVRSTGP